MIQAASIIGTGIATTGLIGAGVGIGVVFLAFLVYTITARTRVQNSFWMPMPGVRCPGCASVGVETWVLPGKNCPKCKCPC